jgi:hypothetical protein
MTPDRAAAVSRFVGTPFFLPNAVAAYRALYRLDESEPT